MRILIVEDERELREIIQQSLAEAGCVVELAADGTEGLYKALECDVDAIVLDLMLPGLSGWDLLARLRAKKDVPVLILSARDDLGDRLRGLDQGADDYLTKPFELSELLARLRALVRRATGNSTATLEFGDVVLDTVRRAVTRGGDPVELTAQEYRLVELLALRRGGVVTRAVIHDHLFGEEDETRSNLVEVHVSNIRKKLRPDFITTRRGHGYQIDG
jgi:two-component system, OmpR family, response regulator